MAKITIEEPELTPEQQQIQDMLDEENLKFVMPSLGALDLRRGFRRGELTSFAAYSPLYDPFSRSNWLVGHLGKLLTCDVRPKIMHVSFEGNADRESWVRRMHEMGVKIHDEPLNEKDLEIKLGYAAVQNKINNDKLTKDCIRSLKENKNGDKNRT